METTVKTSFRNGQEVEVNLTIGDTPRIGDIVSAIVQYGEGPRPARLVITALDTEHALARQPVNASGGGIKLRIPLRFLCPERNRRDWVVNQTPEGLFKEMI